MGNSGLPTGEPEGSDFVCGSEATSFADRFAREDCSDARVGAEMGDNSADWTFRGASEVPSLDRALGCDVEGFGDGRVMGGAAGCSSDSCDFSSAVDWLPKKADKRLLEGGGFDTF